PVDLAAERRAGELVRSAIADGLVTAVHDVSDGGLLVTVAEMALAGGMGALIDPEWAADAPLQVQMFGEDQGRYVVEVAKGDDHRLPDRARDSGVDCTWLGFAGGENIGVGDGVINLAVVPLADLRRAHEGFFPGLMDGEPAVA
ncbi:MAG: AIR synthase-related protein, partial [Allosphingosinicella sp.]